jgi:hypothetical protein
MPVYILFKIFDLKEELIPGLGVGIIPLQPYTNRSVSITLPDRNSPFDVKIKQLPLVHAFALLTEKVQGLTMETNIVGPLRNESRKTPQKAALDVTVSRIRYEHNTRFSQKLTIEDLSIFSLHLQFFRNKKI